MKRGFTLIELLIVVLIIGILSTITAPYLSESLIRARVATSLSNLKTVDTAIKQLMTDQGVMLVDGEDYFSTDWGKERIDSVFHGVGAERYNNFHAILFPLTSPIPYMIQLVEDPFYTVYIKAQHQEFYAGSDAFSNNRIPLTDFYFTYGDNDPAEKFPGKKWSKLYYRFSDRNTGIIGDPIYRPDELSMSPGEYILTGYGPSAELHVSVPAGSEPFTAIGVTYNASNGIRSHGMMILHSSEGVLR